jgi:hypothetical protein
MKKYIFTLLIAAPFIASADQRTTDGIHSTVRTNLRDIKNCYEEALNKKAPEGKIEGKIVAGWEFDKDGTVTKSWIVEKKTTLKNEQVKSCVIAKINTWKFPPNPAGNVTVIDAYPFSLNTKDKNKWNN